jgi:hypothetical protein
VVRADYRQTAEKAIADAFSVSDRGSMLVEPLVIAIIFAWPVLWIVWAFIVRGGITFRLAGIALVRKSGKPAWRLQCAWRALLVWLPLMVCLLLCVGLDDWYWSGWTPGASPNGAWKLWVSWIFWWLAVLILPAGIWLAVRNPPQGPQDRLAGCYLVPR